MPALLPDSGLECETSADQGSAGTGDFPGQLITMMAAAPAEWILICPPGGAWSQPGESWSRPEPDGPDSERVAGEADRPGQASIFPEAERLLPAPALTPEMAIRAPAAEAPPLAPPPAAPAAQMPPTASIRPHRSPRQVNPERGEAGGGGNAVHQERSPEAPSGRPPSTGDQMRVYSPAAAIMPVRTGETLRRPEEPAKDSEVAFAAKITEKPLAAAPPRAVEAPAAGGLNEDAAPAGAARPAGPPRTVEPSGRIPVLQSLATRTDAAPARDLEAPKGRTPGAVPAGPAGAVHAGAATPLAAAPSPEAAERGAPPSQPAPGAPFEPVAGFRPAAPAREIRLQLGDSRAEAVSLQVVDRKGRLEVAVRTPDRDLAGSLRESLPLLVRRMEGAGFRVEAWAPPEAAARLAGQPPEGRPGEPAGSGDPPGEGRPGRGASGGRGEHGDAERQPVFKRGMEADEEGKESETWAAWLRR